MYAHEARVPFHHRLIGETTKGREGGEGGGGEKKEDRRARACLAFPILWTLDPLSLGFNFCLSPSVRATAELPLPSPRVSPRVSFSSRFLPRHSWHDLAGVFRHTMHATMLACPRCGTRRCAQCDSNQEPRPCQRDLSPRLLTIISSLFPVYFSSFFLSVFFLFSTHRTCSLMVHDAMG